MKRTMMALVQDAPGAPLQYRETNIPEPAKGEVLVRMEYAPVNPSDLSFLQGTYAEKPDYPVVPGIEGSGVVVAAGRGILPRLRLNKRVALTATHGRGGTWAEYVVTAAANVVPVGNNISFQQAASLIVNPLTALSFVEIAKKGRHNVVFNNAAAGALGKMFMLLAKDNGIEVLNVVRSAQQLESMKATTGAHHILDSSDKNFDTELKALINKLKPTLYFDAVGGEQTKLLVDYAPSGSLIMPYANLSESLSCFDPRTLLQQDKKIEGFFLGNFTSKLGLFKILRLINRAKKLTDGSLKTKVLNIVEPAEANNAIAAYAAGMSAGKVLIRMPAMKHKTNTP